MGTGLSEYERSAIPACDFNLKDYEQLLLQTRDLQKVGPYKIGALLAFNGLPNVVKLTRRYTNKKLIHDQQKFGYEDQDDTEYDEIKASVEVCKKSGVDYVIVFPLLPGNLERWVKHANKNDLEIIVGAHMTSPNFTVSEGWIWPDQWVEELYRRAAIMGVTKFVIPGNKLDSCKRYIDITSNLVGDPEYIVPGFFGQNKLWPRSNGIEEFRRICNYSFYPIFGPIDGIKNLGQTARKVAEQL